MYNLKPGVGVFDSYRTRETFALAIFWPILATTAVILRFYCKRLRQMRFSWDDWLLLPALFFFYTQIAGNFVLIYLGGFGHQITDVTPAGLLVIAKADIILQFSYGLEMTFIRLSICVLFIKIFFTQTFRHATYAVMAFNIAWFLFTILSVAFLCIPFRYNWDKTIPGGHCISEDGVLAAIAGWSIACDIAVWTLPIPMIWNLHLPQANKIALSSIFALGLVDIAVSIARLVSVLQVNFENPTYSGVPATLWAVAEPAIAILVACAPLYKPLLDKMLPEQFINKIKTKLGSSGHSHGKGGNSAGQKSRIWHSTGTKLKPDPWQDTRDDLQLMPYGVENYGRVIGSTTDLTDAGGKEFDLQDMLKAEKMQKGECNVVNDVYVSRIV